MKINKNIIINKNLNIIIIVILICLYHYLFQNGIEKLFLDTYLNYFVIKRPLERCIDNTNGHNLNCIGMPSGHAETITIFSLLLYFYKIIPLWLCILLIICVSMQRVIFKFHTTFQVIIGIFMGILYTCLYKYFNLSFISFLIVFLFGFILALFIIYNINKKVYEPIPNWVSKEMYNSINKKQNSTFYFKISIVYLSAFLQKRVYLSWNQLEYYLDNIIDNIKNSGIKYDGIVGIKTGGAILSDYISKKLNIKNYKIKLLRSEYKCNKKTYHEYFDFIQRKILNNLGEYIICEGINDNLENKNIILIDELVSTGKTMNESINYLKNEKKVKNITPYTITLLKNYKYKEHINHILDLRILVWPWGFEN
jgi:hypoxanthine phosphoribosyltransferase